MPLNLLESWFNMNINRVYLANIYLVIGQRLVSDRDSFDNIKDNNIYSNLEYIKTALVYKDNFGCFIDLKSNECYSTYFGIFSEGKLVVNLDDDLIPLSGLFNKRNMSKRRILKKYNKIIEGEIK